MTTAPRSAEHRVTAFLDGPDDRNIPNEIHSTEGAKEYGYQAALVGGATVWGWATPAILEALGAGWLDRGWAEIAFRRPTYPGEDLTVTVAPEDGAWALHVAGPDGHDRISGTVGLGDAPWLPMLVTTPYRAADPDLPEHPTLTIDIAPVGGELRALGGNLHPEEMRTFAREKQRTDNPLFVGDRPRLHPGWVAARPIRVLHHSYDYGPAIHARSHIQFLGAAYADGLVTTTARFLEAYERKGHHYGVFDCCTYDAQGNEVIRQRHTTIFGVAKRGEAGD